MSIFMRLKKLREFEKTHLFQLRSIEDFHIVEEIGYCQERGTPLSPRQLGRLGIAPEATVHRRLSRLVALGVIDKRSSAKDARMVELRISPETRACYLRYSRMLMRLHKPKPRRKKAGE
jgi:DNA-binding MarR family transcriptional regulator